MNKLLYGDIISHTCNLSVTSNVSTGKLSDLPYSAPTVTDQAH